MIHGKLGTYTVGGCRCDECRDAMRRYNARLKYDLHRGITRKVEADQAIAHIKQLLADGMSLNSITKAAGYKSRHSIYSILDGSGIINRRTHDRILAIRPEHDIRGTLYIDSTGTRRRLQALSYLGWTSRDLAGRMGHRDHSVVLDIVNGVSATVRRDTATKVARLYDELWDQPGPSTRTAAWARRNGWVPPLAWDDDRIDDPNHEPQTPGDMKRPGGRRPIEHLLEDFEDTRDYHGGDVIVAAARLGMTVTALERALHRAKADGHDIAFHRGEKAA